VSAHVARSRIREMFSTSDVPRLTRAGKNNSIRFLFTKLENVAQPWKDFNLNAQSRKQITIVLSGKKNKVR
jgi:hypothetical protein